MVPVLADWLSCQVEQTTVFLIIILISTNFLDWRIMYLFLYTWPKNNIILPGTRQAKLVR